MRPTNQLLVRGSGSTPQETDNHDPVQYTSNKSLCNCQ